MEYDFRQNGVGWVYNRRTGKKTWHAPPAGNFDLTKRALPEFPVRFSEN